MIKYKLINLDDLESIGLKTFSHKKNEDERGYLKIISETNISSDNYITIKESYTKPFYGRGLHLQSGLSPQTKIIQVRSGKILDIVFDPNDSIQTAFGFYLSKNDNVSIEVPSRFAHGFISIEYTVFEYTCLGQYSEKDEVIFNMLEDISKIMNFDEINLSKKDKSSPKINILNL